MKRELRVLQFYLLLKDVDDELKSLSWTELSDVLSESTLLYHLKVKDVVD